MYTDIALFKRPGYGVYKYKQIMKLEKGALQTQKSPSHETLGLSWFINRVEVKVDIVSNYMRGRYLEELQRQCP